MRRNPPAGTSLIEVTVAITVIAILIALASTSFSGARDIFAVRTARDAIIAASARARAAAIGHGGASLVLDATTGGMRITTRDNVIDERSFMTSSVGVKLQLEGSKTVTTASIAYDALGIGRLASRTITLQRDRAIAGVTFSAYGRPRAW